MRLLVLPGNEAGGDRLGSVLLEAVSLGLERLGFSSEWQARGGLGLDAAAALARTRGASGFVLVNHEERGRDVDLELACYSSQSGELVARSTATGGMDLELDRHVDAAVDELREPLAEAAWTAPTLAAPVPTLPAPGGDGSGPERSRPGDTAEGRIRRLRVSLSGSAFLTVGEAAAYFGVAPGATLTVELVPPILADRLSLGLRATAMALEVRGELAGGAGWLLPAGAEVKVRWLEGGGVSAYLSVTGGAALLSLAPGGIRVFTKALPFVGASLGATVSPWRALGFGLEIGYTAVFERYAPIMGFSPALGAWLAL